MDAEKSDIYSSTGFLFDAVSINLFACLCVLVLEVIIVHIVMVICMIKYRPRLKIIGLERKIDKITAGKIFEKKNVLKIIKNRSENS